MSILVITTGGTIGAIPYKDPQMPPEFSSMPPEWRDIVRDALATTFAPINARCVSLKPLDSKLIDHAYRMNLLQIIATAHEDKILVTHGTDTILKTADFLHHNLSGATGRKSVILTGAMTPLSNGQESDGYQNLQFSLGVLTRVTPALAPVNVVLCDYEHPATKGGAWSPRLYPYRPGQLEKIYGTDGRYNRIRVLSSQAL
jgi:L-asparaginase